MMKNVFFSSLLLSAFFSCLCAAQGQPNPTSDGITGIEGVISVGPVQGGPERQGVASTTPMSNVAFEVKQESRVQTSFTTDDQGHFRVLLPPGHYTVSRKDYAAAIGSYGPFAVDVSPSKMTTVHWECDTGLR